MSLQIPNLHVSSKTEASAKATVRILSRHDTLHAGEFSVIIKSLHFLSADAYPVGDIQIDVDLSDSLKCTVTATSIAEINSWGKHTPTLAVTGRCEVNLREEVKSPTGCRYWLLMANNKKAEDSRGTPDVVSFLVFDRSGVRIAYGTGPVAKGDIIIKPGGD